MFDSNAWTPALQGSISQTCLACIIQVVAPWFVQAQIRAIYTSALPTLCHWLLPMQPRGQPCTHCHATFQVMLWRIVSNFADITDFVNASTVTCGSLACLFFSAPGTLWQGYWGVSWGRSHLGGTARLILSACWAFALATWNFYS